MSCPNCGKKHESTGCPISVAQSSSHPPAPTMKGWECPKCGRIYSPLTSACGACNQWKGLRYG